MILGPEAVAAAVTTTAMNARRHHPASALHHEAMSAQEKLAEVITDFAGSMSFIYIHIAWFGIWLVLNAGLVGLAPFDKYPFGLLTLIVSLEAIFLSTFVMIGQNRQAKFQQIKADQDFNSQTLELHHNTQVTEGISSLTDQIHRLLVEVHATTCPDSDGRAPGPNGGMAS